MRSRLTKLGAALAALVALAIGGAALASASQGTPPAQPAAPAQSEKADSVEANDTAQKSGKPDTDTVQQGDQTGNDETAGETAGSGAETAESESGPSDVPGGYADTNPNADTEQEGSH